MPLSARDRALLPSGERRLRMVRFLGALLATTMVVLALGAGSNAVRLSLDPPGPVSDHGSSITDDPASTIEAVTVGSHDATTRRAAKPFSSRTAVLLSAIVGLLVGLASMTRSQPLYVREASSARRRTALLPCRRGPPRG